MRRTSDEGGSASVAETPTAVCAVSLRISKLVPAIAAVANKHAVPEAVTEHRGTAIHGDPETVGLALSCDDLRIQRARRGWVAVARRIQLSVAIAQRGPWIGVASPDVRVTRRSSRIAGPRCLRGSTGPRHPRISMNGVANRV